MIAIRVLALFTLLLGLVYPLVVTALAQLLFPHQAGGSLVMRNGEVVGSELIGQHVEDPRLFWGRPSATGDVPYGAAKSSGSNLGTKTPAQIEAMASRRSALLLANPESGTAVPPDLLTASASGLDPHISVEAAEFQVSRVARARGMDPEVLREFVKRHTLHRQFGVLGEPVVNVLLLNLDLEK